MLNHADVEDHVRRFIADNFVVEGDADHLPGATSLTQAGVLDSMGVLEMVMFIEERFGVGVPDDDTVPENLDSVDRIVRYIDGRLAEGLALRG